MNIFYLLINLSTIYITYYIFGLFIHRNQDSSINICQWQWLPSYYLTVFFINEWQELEGGGTIYFNRVGSSGSNQELKLWEEMNSEFGADISELNHFGENKSYRTPTMLPSLTSFIIFSIINFFHKYFMNCKMYYTYINTLLYLNI